MNAKLTLNIFRDEIEFFYCVALEAVLKNLSQICIDEFKFISFFHHFQNIKRNRTIFRNDDFDFDRIDFRFFCHVSLTRLQGKRQSETVLINTSQKSVEIFFENRTEFLSADYLIDVLFEGRIKFPINKSIKIDVLFEDRGLDLFFVLCI